jgi:uncharacterized protein
MVLRSWPAEPPLNPWPALVTLRRVSEAPQWVFAAIGGALFAFGAQFARGCTSGAALSGMAVLSTAGFVTTISIFGTGYLVAYAGRKLWL